ncbi:MAG: DoxX family membrane protein [Deltaproteobacteria bacterium]|nr:DoxX family membrane protein [Deltaproteobacteria bacterium]
MRERLNNMRERLDGMTWALLYARWILGLMFLMAGFYKVFELGVGEHARRFFIEGYRDTWIPEWLLWTVGMAIPYVELVAGGMLCLGYRVRGACLAVGSILVIVTYGHLMKEPFFSITDQILPRLVLLLFILSVPSERDQSSLDVLLERRASGPDR